MLCQGQPWRALDLQLDPASSWIDVRRVTTSKEESTVTGRDVTCPLSTLGPSGFLDKLVSSRLTNILAAKSR